MVKKEVTTMGNAYQGLILKLDGFIKKYYKNLILRGTMLSVIIWSTFYLVLAISEYYGQFSVSVRTGLFYSAFALFFTVLVWLILIPAAKYFHIGKTIDHRQAAQIIAKHFSDVQDKLLNILELAATGQAYGSSELVMASIDQKAAELKPVTFKKAINLKENLKYAKYLALLALLFALFGIRTPQIFSESTTRLVQHNVHFEPKAPFSLVLLTDSLFAQKGADFNLQLRVEGDYVPNNVSIAFGGNTFLMKRDQTATFSYEFKNLNNSLEIYFAAEEVQSPKYLLQVLPTPVILNFSLDITPPAYTGEAHKRLSNIGDVTVPYGSRLAWEFNTQDMDSLSISLSDSSLLTAKATDTPGFKLAKQVRKNVDYTLSIANKHFVQKDIMHYSINVIPDLHPTIKVQSLRDSAKLSTFYFQGNIDDDYGFSKLAFKVRKQKEEAFTTQWLEINKNLSTQSFYYAFDFAALQAESGEQFEYFFEVWDNDGIRGSKSSRTQTFEYRVPTIKELADIKNESSRKMEQKMEEGMRLAAELQKDIKRLQQENINQNASNWEKSQMLKDIAQKQQDLKKLLGEVAQDNKNRNALDSPMSEEQQRIMEKQQQIQDLLDQVLSDELKELIDKINELADEFNAEEFNKLSDELDASMESLEDQLDRNLELLKQFEVEQKVVQTIDQLERLAEKQEKLSESMDQKNSDPEKLLEKQKRQQEDFESLMEEYKKAQELNQELEKPMQMKAFEQEMQQIKEQFSQQQQQMQNGKKRKAQKSLQQNSQQMQQMAQQMQQMMEANMGQQATENIDDLRQILENLITFSFEQEDLMNQVKTTSTRDPKFVAQVKEQLNLSDNFAIINDSLMALSKRVSQISAAINNEVQAIHSNLATAIQELEERHVGTASTKQQFVMTSANELALLLSEVLDQLMEQQASSMSGCQQCEKKGSNSKPGMQKMRTMQQQFKQQLEQMLKQLEKEGGEKAGKKGSAKQLAKMLAEQEKFEQMLQEMQNSMGVDPKTQQLLNEVQKMTDQNKKDLIDRKINAQTINRQEQILTRLLQAENAEREREKDKKREAKEEKSPKISNPKEVFEYNRQNSKFSENLNLSGLKLHNFYKKKYTDYLLKLTEQ